MAHVSVHLPSNNLPAAPASSKLAQPPSSVSHGVQTTAELIEGINNLRILQETNEKKFQQEMSMIQQRQSAELTTLLAELKTSQEMFEKLTVEREVLIQRLRQLENAPKNGATAHSRPSALPLGPPSTRTLSFVQTVLGIHYEPLGLVPSAHQERVRPTRQSALQKDKMLLSDMKDDSATEKENKRSSKRQRPAKGGGALAGAHPASGDAPHGTAISGGTLGGAGISMNGPGTEEGSVPLVAKSGTRIRLKPIAHPKVQADDEISNADLSMNDNGFDDSLVGVKAGAKRARSPSSGQSPQKPAKKRNTASTAARNKINIPIIPRGQDGKPLLPMQVGMFTLRDLGRIISSDDLATAKSLYPIGYHCERRWFSTVDPKALVTYQCSIEEGKDPQHPIFSVQPEDAPRETGHSATAAWWNIYKEGLRVRNQPEQAVVNGDEMFGLYDNVVKALLQELPGASEVKNYMWRTFIEGGPGSKRRNTANAVYHIETPVIRHADGWVEATDPKLANGSPDGDGESDKGVSLPSIAALT